MGKMHTAKYRVVELKIFTSVTVHSFKGQFYFAQTQFSSVLSQALASKV